MATPGKAPAQQRVAYVRHRPKHTLLYQIVEEHYPTFRDLLEQQGRSLPACVARVVMSFSPVGDWKMAFCGYAAIAATWKNWWLIAANAVVSAQVAVRDGWWKVQHCWSTKCSRSGPCASGCSVYHFPCASCLSVILRSWGRCCASCIGPSQLTNAARQGSRRETPRAGRSP